MFCLRLFICLQNDCVICWKKFIKGVGQEMEAAMYMLVALVAVLAYTEIASLKKQVRVLQEQVDALAKATGHEAVSMLHVPDDVKARAKALKDEGKTVEAVKAIRESSVMALDEAKKYVDKL